MSRRLLFLNLVLAAVAVLFGIKLARDLAAPRPLPQRPAARAVASDPLARSRQAEPAVRPDQRGLYNVIAARSLFNPSRTESASPPPSAASAVPKPFLNGVVLGDTNDTKSRAYLEDPISKRVFAYAVGDTVGGGKLESIKPDRVVIVRPEGPVEVLLHDPSKPQPAPPAAAPGTPAAAGARPPAIPQPTPAAAPMVPGTPTVQPPNPIPSIPSTISSNPFFRAAQQPQPQSTGAPSAAPPRPPHHSRRPAAGTD